MTPRNLSLVLVRTLGVLVAFLGMAELAICPIVFLFEPVGPNNQPVHATSLGYLQSGVFYTAVGIVVLLSSKKLATIAAKPCTEEE